VGASLAIRLPTGGTQLGVNEDAGVGFVEVNGSGSGRIEARSRAGVGSWGGDRGCKPGLEIDFELVAFGLGFPGG
jgi:hypothetical protein